MPRLLCPLCLALCFTASLYAENTPKFVELKGHTKGVMSAEFSPNGRKIVTGSDDRTARIWDSESGQELHKLNRFGLYAAFSPDGTKVITAGGHENVRIWDANTGRQLLKLERRRSLTDRFARTFINVIPEFGHSAAFSSDGKKIVTGGHGIILVWDAETGRELLQMTNGIRSLPLTAGFSPDGKKIVSTGHGARDKTALIWDAVLGKEVLKLEGHTGEVVSASFSPDGKKIVTASDDSTARIWDADSGKELKQLEHTWRVASAKFSPDGKRIVTAGRGSNIIRIFDAESGKELQKFEELSRGVQAAAFSPDGKKIVTASWDNTARIWDLSKTLAEPP